ncbi:hypothetical protein [Pleomorphomonas carboxyditropha]|uniref:hypothetical protein n=1 Tax=Pleomorphomonas carboxyditropha TaxID=2023338 RepID=UPI001054FD54|nr:hypothetical protein [Pleomorphomonas carboxyditropha]
MLSATIATAGCTTPNQPSPLPAAAKADADVPGIPVSQANKAHLVGCWTNIYYGDFGGALIAEPGEGVQRPYGDKVCFDGEGRFLHVVWYGDEGLDGGGRYSVPRKGALKLDQYDVAWGKQDFDLFFISKDKIKIMYFLNDDKEKTTTFLIRDPSDKYYLEMGKNF